MTDKYGRRGDGEPCQCDASYIHTVGQHRAHDRLQESPDLMDGGVTAARERTEEIREELRNADQLILVERARAERAEKERDEARRERDSWRAQVPLAEWEKELIRATENPRPLTPDDYQRAWLMFLYHEARGDDRDVAVRAAVDAALTEPTRPEGAEELAAAIAEWDETGIVVRSLDQADTDELANHLAALGYRKTP